MSAESEPRNLEKAALRGEPSYVWRAGQGRRLGMILDAAGDRIKGRVLENGCGVGMYISHLAPYAGDIYGLEFEYPRAKESLENTRQIVGDHIVCAAGEGIPFYSDFFDVVLSHEVLEHVVDDRLAVEEMVRVLRPGGCMIVFVPNRGYPFETHGVYWRGEYRFGNIPLVNYLPKNIRDKLAPHVRVYGSQDMDMLFSDLPVRIQHRTVIFGAYDNLILRWGVIGRALRATLQMLEKTPMRAMGLSHFWVVEKIGDDSGIQN